MFSGGISIVKIDPKITQPKTKCNINIFDIRRSGVLSRLTELKILLWKALQTKFQSLKKGVYYCTPTDNIKVARVVNIKLFFLWTDFIMI